ncbi:fibroblast growth factor receptor-like 1 isoform 1-T1 [Salvelinus alpinus]
MNVLEYFLFCTCNACRLEKERRTKVQRDLGNMKLSSVRMGVVKVMLLIFLAILLSDCARGPPRVAERVAHRQSVHLGSSIKLPCPVEGDPPPLIMWTKDGRNIHSGWTRFRILRLGLKIKEVEVEDAGTYICKATNGFGSVSINYTLIVIDDSGADKTGPGVPGGVESEYDPDHLSGKLGRPRFTQPAKMRKRVIARPVGSSVRLKCTASGNPRPDLVWLKDDRPLTEREVGEGRQKKWTLSLRNLTPENSGRYTCRISNQAGEINATYKVEVIRRTNSKPILTGTHPVNTTVDYGGTTAFQCKVRSDVKPVIQWLKRVESNEESRYNSTIEVGDHRFMVLPTGEVWSRPDGSYLNKLLITRAKEEDSGMYICLGANTMGYSFRSAFLTVLPDTKPPIPPVFTPASSTLPLPVIIGIPASMVFIFGTVLLWFCQSKKHCSPPSTPAAAAQVLQASHRLPYQERDRSCVAHFSTSSSPEKDCLGSINYEEYLAQQQLLLTQGCSALPPKTYPDIHTHIHSHVDGKVHQHQHIHFQC